MANKAMTDYLDKIRYQESKYLTKDIQSFLTEWQLRDNDKTQTTSDTNLPKVTIYTDGGCKPNPGTGAYACVCIDEQSEKYKTFKCNSPYYNTTNSRMELCAIILGLISLKVPCEVTIKSDSQYVVNSFTKGWVYSWEKNNWKKASGEKAKHIDLFNFILHLMEIHKVNFVWCRGHNGNLYNELCDQMCTSVISGS